MMLKGRNIPSLFMYMLLTVALYYRIIVSTGSLKPCGNRSRSTLGGSVFLCEYVTMRERIPLYKRKTGEQCSPMLLFIQKFLVYQVVSSDIIFAKAESIFTAFVLSLSERGESRELISALP